MNQKGRDFLEKKVRQWAVRERKALDVDKPKRPKWKPELSAQIINGQFAGLKPLKDIIKPLKEAIKKKNGFLFGDADRYWDDEEEPCKEVFTADIWLFFEKPDWYVQQLEKYQEDMAGYQKKKKAIDTAEESLVMKIQIGSDKMLAPLVEQVDGNGSLTIANSRVLLIESK